MLRHAPPLRERFTRSFLDVLERARQGQTQPKMVRFESPARSGFFSRHGPSLRSPSRPAEGHSDPYNVESSRNACFFQGNPYGFWSTSAWDGRQIGCNAGFQGSGKHTAVQGHLHVPGYFQQGHDRGFDSPAASWASAGKPKPAGTRPEPGGLNREPSGARIRYRRRGYRAGWKGGKNKSNGPRPAPNSHPDLGAAADPGARRCARHSGAPPARIQSRMRQHWKIPSARQQDRTDPAQNGDTKRCIASPAPTVSLPRSMFGSGLGTSTPGRRQNPGSRTP